MAVAPRQKTPGHETAGHETPRAEVDAEQRFEIFVINLDRSPDRRAAMTAQADALGLRLTFVRAVDGRTLSEEDAAAYRAPWRRRTWRAGLTPNEVACVLSHRRALGQFLESGAAFAVVLEDDAILGPEFRRVVHELIDIAPVWDLVRLSTYVPTLPLAEVATLPSGRRLGQRGKWGLSAVGVLYDRRAAARLLEGSRRFFEAFDNLLGRPWAAGGYILELDRPIVGYGGTQSTLETEASRAAPEKKRMRGWWRLAVSAHRRLMGPVALRRFRAAAARGPDES